MANNFCCNSAGGTVRLTFGGVVYPVRGNVSIMPTDREVTVEANLDRSVYTTHKPVPRTIELSLSDSCGLSIDDLMANQCTDITIDLDEVGRTYVLVEAGLAGRPSLDPTTGEISGISLYAGDIRQLNTNN